jgi:hypothetical protein
VLEAVLTGWQTVEANVILDGVEVYGDRLQIFRLSLQHGCRAIPVVWTVIPGRGLTQVEKLETMLTHAAQFFQSRVKSIRFLADRGFRDCDWAQLCFKLGWNYDIRVANNTVVEFTDQSACSIDQLGVSPGQSHYFQGVCLTEKAKFITNLSVTWTKGDDRHAPKLLAVISNQYSQRTDIEQSFRDDQSGGFDMEHTRLQQPAPLERMLLALSIATLWCHELGEYVLAGSEERRREIDPGFHRELSLFQLGQRWLQRRVSTDLDRLPGFQAHLSPINLTPNAQHEKH